MDFDPEIHNVSLIYSTVPDGISSTVISCTVELFKVVENLKTEISINFPESPTDTKYLFLEQVFRTSINFKKMLQGINGNSIIRSIAEKLLNSLNFTFEFPIKPGLYKVSNLTYQGKFLPPISTLFREEVKTIVKLKGQRKMNFLSLIVMFAKLN